jgi:hypothetical protein
MPKAGPASTPITQDGKVVDSQGYILDLEDDEAWHRRGRSAKT